MKLAIILLTMLMISKDSLPIGDVYIMRGLSQITAFMIGLYLVFAYFQPAKLLRQKWVLTYLILVVVSAFLSEFVIYSSLQAGSLFASLLLFIGLTMLKDGEQRSLYRALSLSVFWVYLIVSVASLALYFVSPNLVVQKVYGNEIRFTGLFSEPAMMGTAAGLLFGAGLLVIENKSLKLIGIVVAVTCMFLTLSRTFILASIAASLMAAWFYQPKLRKLVLPLGITALIGISAFVVIYAGSSVQDAELNNIVRTDSIGNLSGRPSLWAAVIEARIEAPLAGEGFSLGGALLYDLNSISGDIDPRAIGRTTLHSGYFQALADLGLIGGVLYTLLILVASFVLISRDRVRRYPMLCYILIFMAISNAAESVIYTASNFPSIFFWYALITVMGMTQSELSGETERPIHAGIKQRQPSKFNLV